MKPFDLQALLDGEREWFLKNERRLPYMCLDALVHEVWQAAFARA